MKAMRQRTANQKAANERQTVAAFGMTSAELNLLAPGVPLHSQEHPKRRYISHRNNAKMRGIEWQFTFITWWAKWGESGKWNQRGMGADRYCMARFGDVGPYSPDNVRIATHRENLLEGYQSSPWTERWPNGHPLPNKVRGKPKAGSKGYRCEVGSKCSKTKPWTAYDLHSKRIGKFATEAEAKAAREAYLSAIQR